MTFRPDSERNGATIPGRPVPTASEALYAFMGWLTTRKQIAVFSSNHDAALAAELVKEFCDANKLPEPRDNWTDIWNEATR